MLGIGFIGTGGVAERHAEALRDVPGARLVAVWSRRAEARSTFAARHGARAHSTVEALLADPQIGAVFVLTNADSHVDYTLQALAAGTALRFALSTGCSGRTHGLGTRPTA